MMNLETGSGPLLSPEFRLEDGFSFIEDDALDTIMGNLADDWFLDGQGE